jgi:hypothetical protein
LGAASVSDLSATGSSLNTRISSISGSLSEYYPRTNPSGYITTGNTGNFYPRTNPSGFITGVNLSAYTLNSNTGSFISTSQTGVFIAQDYHFSGDLTGHAQSLVVKKLQGHNLDVENEPADGQILQWNAGSSSWRAGAIPVGGNGGGGRVYYLNFANTSGISPINGLPNTGHFPVSLLGRDYNVGSGFGESLNLTPKDTDILMCGFVTASGILV